MKPGVTAFTVTPSGPSSNASPRTRPSAAALAAPSTLWPPMAWKLSIPETSTMRPGRPAMSGTTAWVIATKASTVIAKVRRTLWGFCSSTGRKAVAAAFATSTSTRPKAAPMRSKAGPTCSGSASSSRSARAPAGGLEGGHRLRGRRVVAPVGDHAVGAPRGPDGARCRGRYRASRRCRPRPAPRAGRSRLAPRAEAPEDRLGLLHDRRHHLAGRAHVADQPSRLPGRRAAVLHVALLARPDRGGLAHPLVLDRERLDLGLPALPLAGERIADLAVGLAGYRVGHHRAFLVDGRDLPLVVVVAVRLGGGDEARAHPDPGRPQRERGHEPAPVGNPARRHHEPRRHRIHHRLGEHDAAHAPGVAAALVTLRDDHVHPVGRVIARLLHVAAEGHHGHAEAVRLRGERPRVAEPRDQHRHALLERHVAPAADCVGERLRLPTAGPDGGEEDVDAAGPIGQLPSRRISSRRSAGLPCAAAMTPSPPAAVTAAASSARATKAMPAWQIG